MKQLESAAHLISSAIQSLERLDAPPSEFARSLESAASVLRGAGLILPANPATHAQLVALKHRAETASALLESAAVLRFGCVLQNGIASDGYGNDGAINCFGGRGFQIDA